MNAFGLIVSDPSGMIASPLKISNCLVVSIMFFFLSTILNDRGVFEGAQPLQSGLRLKKPSEFLAGFFEVPSGIEPL